MTTVKNFWSELNKPFFILAPMEAVTDIVFRHVIMKASRPDVFFTEFTNSDSFVNPKGNHATRSRLEFSEDEQPIVAQIWGKTPEHFEYMSYCLRDRGFYGIDINMGCPDKTVVKNGCGSGLIKSPELAGKIIASTKKAGLPVSVKTRLGDSRVEEWYDWLSYLLNQNIANLTIHLRTRKEMSKVGAHHELIDDIKNLRDQIAPHTLLTLNGDIKDRIHGQTLVDMHQVDGIMIGRGVFANPYAFEISPIDHTSTELLELLWFHLELFDTYSNSLALRYDPLKRFFKIYVKHFAGASELREQLMLTKNTDQARKTLLPFMTPNLCKF